MSAFGQKQTFNEKANPPRRRLGPKPKRLIAVGVELLVMPLNLIEHVHFFMLVWSVNQALSHN